MGFSRISVQMVQTARCSHWCILETALLPFQGRGASEALPIFRWPGASSQVSLQLCLLSELLQQNCTFTYDLVDALLGVGCDRDRCSWIMRSLFLDSGATGAYIILEMGALGTGDKLNFKLFLKYFTDTRIILICQNMTKMLTKFSSVFRFVDANALELNNSNEMRWFSNFILMSNVIDFNIF